MSEPVQLAAIAGATVSSVVWARAFVLVRLASIRASKAANAAEFVMMEKAAKPFKVKAHKSPAPIPYGL